MTQIRMSRSLAESAARLKDVNLHAESPLPDHLPPNTKLAKSDFHTQPSLPESEISSEFTPKARTEAIHPVPIPFGLDHIREQKDDFKETGYDAGTIQALAQSKSQASHSSSFPGPVEKEIAQLGFGLSGCKTVMMKNVPLAYKQSHLLEVMNKPDFAGQFDFLYLPAHVKDGNRGFAFVNFTKAEYAEEFYSRYNGNFDLFDIGRAQQPLSIMPAAVQGLKANVENLVYHRHWHAWQEPPFIMDTSAASIMGLMGVASGVTSTPAKFQTKLQKMSTPSRQKGAMKELAVHSTSWQRSRTKLFCEYCGRAREQDHLFCAFCGERFH